MLVNGCLLAASNLRSSISCPTHTSTLCRKVFSRNAPATGSWRVQRRTFVFDLSDVEQHIRHVIDGLHRYFKSQVGIFRAGGDFVSIPSVELSIKTVINNADHRFFVWNQGRSACARNERSLRSGEIGGQWSVLRRLSWQPDRKKSQYCAEANLAEPFIC